MNGPISDKLVFDTVSVIDIVNERYSEEKVNAISFGVEKYISVITRIELYTYPNLGDDEKNRIDTFLSGITVVPLTDKVEQEAIKFRRGTKRKLPDSIIAATSIVLSATLITRDTHLLGLNFPGLHTTGIA